MFTIASRYSPRACSFQKGSRHPAQPAASPRRSRACYRALRCLISRTGLLPAGLDQLPGRNMLSTVIRCLSTSTLTRSSRARVHQLQQRPRGSSRDHTNSAITTNGTTAARSATDHASAVALLSLYRNLKACLSLLSLSSGFPFDGVKLDAIMYQNLGVQGITSIWATGSNVLVSRFSK